MSRLVAIEIQNFMSIAEARIEFDDNNIINLCGYNDSGKSAITRLLQIMFYNSYSTEQARYIKEGTEFWVCSLEFDDGVEVNRYKYADGKSVYEMFKGGKCVFTNRRENGTVLAMDNIPDVIANYLGVIKDEHTGEILNVRRNTDKLFLINTSGGDNYKILNAVLNSDVLADASKTLNEDRNKLQTQVVSLTTSAATLKNEVESLNVVDSEIVDSLEETVKKVAVNKQRVDYLTAIVEQKEKIDNLIAYEELPKLDTSRLSAILEIQKWYDNMTVVAPQECKGVNTDKLRELENIMCLNQSMDIIVPPECAKVSFERYTDIIAACQSYNRLWEVSNQLANIEAELVSDKTKLETLSKTCGFKICKNCGTVVE